MKTTSDQLIFCPHCDAQQLKTSARFCHACGQPIPVAPAVGPTPIEVTPAQRRRLNAWWLLPLLLIAGVALLFALWEPARDRVSELVAGNRPAVTGPASRGSEVAQGTRPADATAGSIEVTSVAPTETLAPLPTFTPLASATPRPTATPHATATPAPTNTSQPPPAAATRYLPVSLQGVANASTMEGYVNPPVGDVVLGGVPFSLGQGQSVTTQAGPLPNHPTRVTLPVDISGPQAVYLLLTGGDLYTRFAGAIIGQVRLAFADGREHRVDLIGGQNIREWKHYDANVISRASSPDLTEVWRGGNKDDSGAAVIDMLKITLPANLRGGRLTAIGILDRSTETVGNLDPAINLLGVTVAALQPAQAGPIVQPCAVETAAKFRSLWQQYRAALGCPRGRLVEDGGAIERFQRGRLLWRKDNDMIYVLYDEGDWLGTPDTSVDGAPEPGGYQPPAGLFTPVRGFGITWRERLGGPSARIGWATEQEYWLPMPFQDFQRGLMFEMDNKIYLLGEDGRRWLAP